MEGQLRQLEEERCDRIYFEKITGTKSDRPEFQKLLQKIQTGDTLVVTKLDRFARSTQDALSTIKLLLEKGVKVNVLNLGIIENTSTGRLIFTIFSVFADFERNLIVELTQEGKELVKQRPDFREGRPKKILSTKNQPGHEATRYPLVYRGRKDDRNQQEYLDSK